MQNIIKNKTKIKLKLDNLQISQGPDGSLDFLWRDEGYSLLLNVPENSDAEYYFKSKKYGKLKGTIKHSIKS